jgi:four helix bundle protein
MAKCVEELQVWQRAEALARAVFAATESPAFARQPRLAEHVNESAASVLANIAEGFGQGSDRGFAKFVGIARGSCNELRSHLAIAAIRRCIPDDVRRGLHEAAEEISRMLTGLERYLLTSDRTRR